METKETMRAIRIALGAANAEAASEGIAREFIPQVQQAREHLSLLRGTTVIEALSLLSRSGCTLAIDVRAIDVRQKKVGFNEKTISR